MLDFTEEQRMAQKAIRAWCAQVLEPKVPAMEAGELSIYPTMREMAQTFGIPDIARALFARQAKASAAEADADVGAAGGGPAGGHDSALIAILHMELSRVCPGFALSFGATVGLFGGSVMARGTDAQRRTWALPVLTFDKIGAWALTEPGAGSDAFGSMKTRARKVSGGYRITGSKTLITNAPFADTFVVYARVAGDDDAPAGREPRAFIVERQDPGVGTGRPMKKMGMRASPTGEIFLDDVFVGDDRLLGGEAAEGSGRAAAKSSLNQERFAMTSMCLGIVDRSLEEALRYAKTRTQWGKPIATFQLVQERLARIETARTVMHALLMRQIEAARDGVPLSQREASSTKLYCARMATECAMDAIQVLGGAGYMEGSVVEMLARDAKLFQIGGGTDDIQILRIARELLEE